MSGGGDVDRHAPVGRFDADASHLQGTSPPLGCGSVCLLIPDRLGPRILDRPHLPTSPQMRETFCSARSRSTTSHGQLPRSSSSIISLRYNTQRPFPWSRRMRRWKQSLRQETSLCHPCLQWPPARYTCSTECREYMHCTCIKPHELSGNPKASSLLDVHAVAIVWAVRHITDSWGGEMFRPLNHVSAVLDILPTLGN